jgi:hypothetical protein
MMRKKGKSWLHLCPVILLPNVYAAAATTHKSTVFTRPNGVAVGSLREAWERACCKAGLGGFTCIDCKAPSLSAGVARIARTTESKYTG